MADPRPIGVFDSGMGGLSVLKALVQKLPYENYIYFGDTARAPYGDKTPEVIRGYNREIGSWLISMDCKMLVVACNTSTVLGGMDEIRAMSTIPVIGMADAVTGEVLRADQDSIWPVGFIATKGTVESGVYQRIFDAAKPGSYSQKPGFYAAACPALVPMVEVGVLSGPEVDRALCEYISPLLAEGIRTLILGCTHYPFLKSAVVDCVGSGGSRGVQIVDPALEMAVIVTRLLEEHDLTHTDTAGSAGQRAFYCSGKAADFEAVGSVLWGSSIKVKSIDISGENT